MVALRKSQTSLKVGHVGSKARSHFRSDYHELGQNIYLDKISDQFDQVMSDQNVETKTRSLGQILEKPCVRYGGHIFDPIIVKPCQNVCLDDNSEKNENGSCWVKN